MSKNGARLIPCGRHRRQSVSNTRLHITYIILYIKYILYARYDIECLSRFCPLSVDREPNFVYIYFILLNSRNKYYVCVRARDVSFSRSNQPRRQAIPLRNKAFKHYLYTRVCCEISLKRREKSTIVKYIRFPSESCNSFRNDLF